MASNDKKFNEKELRSKIRKELEKEHETDADQNSDKTDEETRKIRAFRAKENSYFMEHFLRSEIEEKIYSKYPDFIRCGNHLQEVKWLTPLELEDEFEFYPFDETFWEKLTGKFRKVKHPKIPESPELRQLMSEYAEKIEKEAQERVELYREKLKKNERRLTGRAHDKIVEDEQNKFYKKRGGYKKYQNHIGEYRWMTKEEYESQDEFFEEVESKGRILLKRVLIVIALLLVAGIIWSIQILSTPNDHPKAYLVVSLNENRGHLYIDQNLAVGFKANSPYPIETGEHEISLIRAGYIIQPKMLRIDAGKGDTVRIAFELIPRGDKESGVVRIHAPYSEAAVFVDGEFQGTVGNNPIVHLPEGQHTISLNKEKYISSPRQHTFKLSPGDTLDLSFSLSAVRSMGTAAVNTSPQAVGLIDIHSNIKNAVIFLDGHETDFQTDYVLQKIPLGQHIIKVYKDGYKSYPEEKVVKLSEDQKRVSADFTLTSTAKPVTIRTFPVDGAIFVDGKLAGTGTFSATLIMGEHRISFGDLEYYQKPDEQTIDITPDGDDHFEFYYTGEYYVSFSNKEVEPASALANINVGYMQEDGKFTTSRNNGPDILTNNILKEKIWHLGYAFQYRNPPGSDAVLLRFKIPTTLDLKEPLHLKLWVYKTGENYPLAISGKPYYRIFINHTIFKDEIMPRYDEKEAGEGKFEVYRINSFLKPGYNTIIIATSEKASGFLNLWKARIE